MRFADSAPCLVRLTMAAVEIDHGAVLARTRRGGQTNLEAEVGTGAPGLEGARPVIRGNQQLDCHWRSDTVHFIIVTRTVMGGDAIG